MNNLTETIFSIEMIPDEIFENMQGKSFQENEWITRNELRYLRVFHYGFDGKVHQGELIVNEQIAEEILEIMKELFAHQYPIEKMRLIDEYDADDNRSMEDNNSSAFNYRLIAGTNRLSRHSLGLAIDINPKYNPYIRPDGMGGMLTEQEGSEVYADRSQEFPYKIDEKDLCYRLFKDKDYVWGGDWTTVKDYQHFQKNFSKECENNSSLFCFSVVE